ncbi:MAG: Wzz/FepE/Etk N-terminal domain-containing protein, partial [Pyrinomonadaceae bacterium]
MKDPRDLIQGGAGPWELERPGETPSYPPAFYGYDPEPAAEDEAHLRDYWRLVRKYLWLIALITLLATTAATVYMARIPDFYEAEAQVQVDLENNPAMGVGKGGSVIITNPVNDPSYFKTQLQILNSPGLMRRVAKTLDLEHNPDFLRPKSAQERSTLRGLKRMVGLGGGDKGQGKNSEGEEILRAGKVAPPVSTSDLEETRRLARYVSRLQRGLNVQLVQATRLI